MRFQNFIGKINIVFGNYLFFWKQKPKITAAYHLLFLAVIVPLGFFIIFLKAPQGFPEESLFTIEQGQTLSEVASNLEKSGFIKSDFWFRNIVILFNGEGGIKTGEYFFQRPQSSYLIAKRIISGTYDLSPIRVTVHEGLNIFEIAELLENAIPKFDKEKFVRLAEKKEGFLFPDTYFLTPNSKAEEIIKIMENNFQDKIEGIKDKIENFNKPLEDVIKMASIIETEARDKESRRVISGILWSRIEIGMALQVDVTFKYINGKNTYELTSEDLDIDSPYNTYRYRGLPPTPIANPGLDAILATIEPVETDYLYFLSDMRGNMHYAVTHDDHVENKRLYLRN